MSKDVRAAMWVFSLVAGVPCASTAAFATTYEVGIVPSVEKSSAMGVNNRSEVLASTSSKHKGQVTSALCKVAPPECRRLAIKYGGGNAIHPSRYIFLRPAASKVSTVGQVYVQKDWYAAYKYGLGRSRFHNDVIITPGIAYGVGGGLVVGETSKGEAFSYGLSARKLLTLRTLNGNDRKGGSAQAVNTSGTIVGHSTNAEGLRHATMWVGKEAQDMGVLPDGGQTSSARSINDAGVAVGCGDKGAGLQVAVKFEGGAVVELGALSAESGTKACATIISAEGAIAGWSTVVPGEETHAFIMEGEAMVDLNDRISEADRSLYELMSVGGINATGKLAVTAKRRADSATVVLLLTPRSQL